MLCISRLYLKNISNFFNMPKQQYLNVIKIARKNNFVVRRQNVDFFFIRAYFLSFGEGRPLGPLTLLSDSELYKQTQWSLLL